MSVVPATTSVFHAVADPVRRQLLDRLRETECTFSELAEPLPISRPAVSQHLRVLRETGLVLSRREGRDAVYRLRPTPLREVYEWLSEYGFLIDPGGHLWRVHSRENLEK